MGNVKIQSGSQLEITSIDQGNLTITPNSKLQITRVKDIDPVAAHIKEINHIDPITIDELHVNEVKNIDPINIAKFNITNLPTMNMTVRQLPAVDFNVNKLPAVSVGTHQNFSVPSRYKLRVQFLGIEFFRMYLDGLTSLMPQEKFRREQGKSHDRSYPVTAVAGNPAIPSSRGSLSGAYASGIHAGASPAYMQKDTFMINSASAGPAGSGNISGKAGMPISVGLPPMSFQIPDKQPSRAYADSRVMSGD
jgi:hypothetical protein